MKKKLHKKENNNKNNKNKEKIYVIASILIIIDQLIKLVIKSKMKLGEEIIIIKNFFSLYYIKNPGAAFSILEDYTYLLIILGIGLLIILDKYLDKEEKFNIINISSFGLIIGGIVGNLIDRILYRGVIDYLMFKFFGYTFPVFNLADICITLGVVLYIVAVVIDLIKEKGGFGFDKSK